MDCTGKESNVFGETVKSINFKRVKPKADSVSSSKDVVIKPCTAGVQHNGLSD